MSQSSNRKLVVALGGNAISTPGEQGTIYQQFMHSRESAELLCDAIQAGYQLVITHGNGPQVGNILRRSEIAASELYPIPLDVCVADTQAGMGYMIAQSLMNEFSGRQQSVAVTTIVTTVEVDRQDPAFGAPNKPIGPRLNAADAQAHQQDDGWDIVKLDDQVYRRVVASPQPQKIEELSIIRRLVDAGELVICCGGGGIPVYRNEQGLLKGAAAVIDKDLTTALLARELDISTLVMLTSVDRVYLNFGRRDQRALDEITREQAQQYLDDGQFEAGSMAPKIEAAIDFLTHAADVAAQVIIADLTQLTSALDGSEGTRILP
ncbi:MAG: carbamate kinase [Bythopirellula sp.]